MVTCTDLQRISISVLRREFGQKTGEMLYKYCRGHDDRQLMIERERKSVSAEINYAMRFEEVRVVFTDTGLSHSIYFASSLWYIRLRIQAGNISKK